MHLRSCEFLKRGKTSVFYPKNNIFNRENTVYLKENKYVFNNKWDYDLGTTKA